MSTLEPVKVLVVDDSAHNRRLLTELLESSPGVKVVGTAGSSFHLSKASRVSQTHTPITSTPSGCASTRRVGRARRRSTR